MSRFSAASLALLATCAMAESASAQDAGLRLVTPQSGVTFDAEGVVIDEVRVEGAAGLDANLIRTAVGYGPGDTFDAIGLTLALRMAEGRFPGQTLSYRLELTSGPSRAILVVHAARRGKSDKDFQFPILHQTDDTSLTLILNGAFGAYSDFNPWFRNGAALTASSPVATHPATGSSATWTEASAEYGLGGITRIGDGNAYAYAGLTAMSTWSAGQELFTDETRTRTEVEKAYVGLLVAEKGSDKSLNLSVGRQNFNLQDGFLISQFSGGSNAGPRPGLYLNPRTAFDLAAVGDLRWGPVKLRAFLLDPNELEGFDSGTEFAGFTIVATPMPSLDLGGSYIEIPESKSTFRTAQGRVVPRKGLQTLALYAKARNIGGVSGLWAQGEYALQDNPGKDVKAWAGYVTVGRRFENAPFAPALSYRYSAFSGDDPATPTYERYDPLLGGGLSEWVQGINFKKVIANSNADVQRLRLNASLNERITVTLDAFDFRARELNNIGGNPAMQKLASRRIGSEYTARIDWVLRNNIFLLGVLSHAHPGDGVAGSLPVSTRPWTSAQVSLFWRF